jgi:importin subunit beta-1
MAAMRSGEATVQLQGIEFWSNVCENEISLIAEAQEAADARQAPENICYYYAKGALAELVPILLELLTTTDIHDDPDEWTVAKVSGLNDEERKNHSV